MHDTATEAPRPQKFVFASDYSCTISRRWQDLCSASAEKKSGSTDAQARARGGALPFMRVRNGEARTVAEQPEPEALAAARASQSQSGTRMGLPPSLMASARVMV